MSMDSEVERILNNFLVALQLALGVWQFMKRTPIGALIQGVIGAYLLRPFRLSKTYGRLLRDYDGRVFKRANCYVLQPDIPSERTIAMNESDRICLYYFGTEMILERRGSEKNMLFIENKMRYYIVPTVWDELKTMERVLYSHDRSAAHAAHAAAFYAAADAAFNAHVAAADADSAAAADYNAAASRGRFSRAAFVKGRREFWEEVITGGVMELEEVLDRTILDNQRVSTG